MNNEEFQKITHATNNINSNLLPEMTQITADRWMDGSHPPLQKVT
jgi:hypothetical protein